MAGTLVHRSEDTVREDFKQFVCQWIGEGNEDHTLFTLEEIYLLDNAAIKLQEPNGMLTKGEATLCNRLLYNQAANDMALVLSKHNDPNRTVDVLQEVDCLSLYSDIYHMYLRPGTYSHN